jgi:hypothetical protein
MSTTREDRYGTDEPGHRKSLLASLSRPNSSHIVNNELLPKQNFMKYKIENRKTEAQTKERRVSISKRDERRKSKASIDYSGKKIDESTAMPAQASVGYGIDSQDNLLPLKIFDGTKKAITDVSEQSRSYFWLRRIKEIFLQMGTNDKPFVEFDMSLARVDMLTTCDVYLRNDFSKLKKKV